MCGANSRFWSPAAQHILARSEKIVRGDAGSANRDCILLQQLPDDLLAQRIEGGPALRCAFFSRLGNRALFFLASLGTFGSAGVARPTAAAIFPAAVPTLFAAATRVSSGASSFTSFFFAIRAYSIRS